MTPAQRTTAVKATLRRFGFRSDDYTVRTPIVGGWTLVCGTNPERAARCLRAAGWIVAADRPNGVVWVRS